MESLTQLLVSSFVVVISAAPSMALACSELPAARHAGSVTYLSGGNTPAQEQAMQNDVKRYPLELRFVWGRGVKETLVNANGWSIRDAAGIVVAMGSSSGPIVLASLPNGRYTVLATYNGDTLTRIVQVCEGVQNDVLLEWPQ